VTQHRQVRWLRRRFANLEEVVELVAEAKKPEAKPNPNDGELTTSTRSSPSWINTLRSGTR